MSINWVMVSPQSSEPFIKLPNERVLYVSPARTTLSLSSSSTYPGTQPWSVKSDGGVVYLTNQRLVYIPTNPHPDLENFSCPILNLVDTYVRAPFFGANYWTATVRPVSGGGIPPTHLVVELRMTFRDGGAFDYHTLFEQVKERLQHAVQLARDEGRNIGSVGVLNPADLAGVHLEQLPAYEAAREVNGNDEAPLIDVHSGEAPTTREGHQGNREPRAAAAPSSSSKEENQDFAPPDEPPPGYEEAQAQAVGIDLDQRLREDAERGRNSDDD